MIEMLAGALLFAYLMAGLFFVRFWRRTRDRLFLHFAIAFWLFVLNQLATSVPDIASKTNGYEYLLRVLGFIVIIVGIVDKNVAAKRGRRSSLAARAGASAGTTNRVSVGGRKR
jgi:hypothetical protein